MSVLDFIYVPLFLLIALYSPSFVLVNDEKKYISILRKIIFFHFVMGIVFYFFILNNGGDAMRYYNIAKYMSFEEFSLNILGGEGTSFMEAFNYIPVNILGMSFLSNSMFYSLMGSIGIVLFYAIAIRVVPYNTKQFGYALFPLVFFMPNLHFWSAGVGKDTILFLCIGMFSYGIMQPLKRIPLLIISILLSLAIRPHITLFLLVGFGVAYIMRGKVPLWQRILLSMIMLAGGMVILPSVMEFAKIEEASASGFEQFATNKAEVLSRSRTGSAIDISSYPFPLKVFTFWFRPLFFDVRNINGLISSIENGILLLLFIKILRLNPIKAFSAAPFVIKGLVLFLIVGTLAFSQSLGNVGIMIRMRNMFLPGMLLYILWVFSFHQTIIRNRIMNSK